MVIYYHTGCYIFAVANDRIASILGVYGGECPVSLVGAKLLGVMNDKLEAVTVERIGPGHRLKFELGGVGFITDRITKIETVGSLSIPPAPRESVIPDTIKIRDPIPTLPEILYPNLKNGDE